MRLESPRRPGAMRMLRVGALVLAGLGLAPAIGRAATVHVTTMDVRSARGFIRIALCSRATFLTENCEYFADAPAHAGVTEAKVTGVKPGIYAVQVFDDDLGQGVIHRGLFGIPREGIGFSRDAKLHLKGPRFDEAAIDVVEPAVSTRLTLRYLHLRRRPVEQDLP